MQRSRIVVLALIATAVFASGCGEDAQGPAPIPSSGIGRPASEVTGEGQGAIEKILGNDSAPVGTRLTSSIGTVPAHYGPIAGATNIDNADLTSALSTDDPFDRVDEISSEWGNDLLSADDKYTPSMDMDPVGDVDGMDIGAAEFDAGLDADTDLDLGTEAAFNDVV